MAKKAVVAKNIMSKKAVLNAKKEALSWAALVKLDKEEHGAEDAEWKHYLARERAAAVDKEDDMIEYVPSSPCYCP